MAIDLDKLSDEDLLAHFGGGAPVSGENQSHELDTLSDDDLLKKFSIQEPNNQKAAPSEISSYAKEVARQVGLTGRYIAEGAPQVAIPLMVGDALNTGINYGIRGINKIADTNVPELGMPSREYSNALTRIGIPNPQDGTERVIGDISRGVAGVGGSVWAGQFLQNVANPVSRGIGNTLTAAPISQAVSAGGGSLAGGVSRENDANPLTQLIASVAGGLAPGGVAAGAGKINNVISGGGVRPEIVNLAKKASGDVKFGGYGIDIPAAQISQNPFVKWLDSALPNIPFSGHGGEKANALSQFTRAVSRTFGEDTPSLTRDVMADAGDKIGSKFQDIAKNTPSITLNDKMLNKLSEIHSDASDVLGSDASKITKQIEKITALSKDGAISGDSWNALTRTGTPLDRLAKSTDPNVSFYARNIKDALYDGLEDAASPELVEGLRNAKMQWKNYKTVQDLAAKAGVTGEINPVLLLHKTNQATKRFGNGGLNALEDLSDIGQTFFKGMPSSGTAERQFAMKLFGAGGGAGGLGVAALTGNVPAIVATSAGAAGSVAAARAASKFLNSDYYRNMLLNKQNPNNLMPAMLGTAGSITANSGR